MKKLMLGLMSGLLMLVACSKSDPVVSKTFVLVHGAWQGAYVWDEVKVQLEAKGQKVVVVELPAHGGDQTAPVATTIDIYRDKVINAIGSTNTKVILVGHSMGGVVVSAVAEKSPASLEKVIYIGAFVPGNGQSLIDLAFQDTQSQLGPNLIPSADQLTLDVKHDNIISIFCQDASADKQQLVLTKYRVEPAIPFTNKLALTEANFGSVDKYYIHTTLDHAIGTELQNKMVAGANITKVYSIETGHSPFLSKPDEVATLFMTIAK
jgi:pimeloyl-ACP methyl ester carboxylesterase